MSKIIIVHQNETLRFLKILVENFNSPKLTYLHQESKQEVRFIPTYLDIEKEVINQYFSLRTKIKRFGKQPAEIYERTLKRAIFLEFNNDTSNLNLNLVGDQTKASDFIAVAEEINKLNNNNIFNSLKKVANNKYYFHQVQLLNKNELQELDLEDQDFREKKLISLFKLYVPILLKRLDILFPEPF